MDQELPLDSQGEEALTARRHKLDWAHTRLRPGAARHRRLALMGCLVMTTVASPARWAAGQDRLPPQRSTLYSFLRASSVSGGHTARWPLADAWVMDLGWSPALPRRVASRHSVKTLV